MAIIPQAYMFCWQDVEAASDLQRLEMVLSTIPDEPLMQALEAERNRRRDDYPIRAVWNSVLAGVVFQHESIESLRRELSRNAQLRQVCGFPPTGAAAVPTAPVYTRLLSRIVDAHLPLVEEMFNELVTEIRKALPDFGKRLVIDGKELPSHARKQGGADAKKADRRRETDADYGKKTYHCQRQDGTVFEKIKSWFGFQLIAIVDAATELPVAFRVTRASAAESPQLIPMMKELEERHPEVVQRTIYLFADRGYDAQENNKVLWDEMGIKPVIDTRRMWQDEPDMPRPLYEERMDSIVYTEKGQILCRCRDGADETKNYEPMVFEGFEADRNTLKYRCPAAAHGWECPLKQYCNSGQHTAHGRIVRVPLDKDRRIFTPVARPSLKWEREYKHRTAVERFNSRLDVSFGMEHHFVRGLQKMTLRVSLALVVMLSMALARIRAGKQDLMRSLVQAA